MDFDEEIFYPDNGFSESPAGGTGGGSSTGCGFTNGVGSGCGMYDPGELGFGYGEKDDEILDKSGYGGGNGYDPADSEAECFDSYLG